MASDEADKLDALTPDQKRIIKTTFAKFIEDDMAAAGLSMFVKMLTDKPSLKHLFAFCENTPPEKLKDCTSLKRHGFNVMLSMGRAISLLDNKRQLRWNMNALGTRHGYRNVKPEYFKDMQEALALEMEKKLGSDYTPEVAETWRIWFGSVSTLMSQGIRQHDS